LAFEEAGDERSQSLDVDVERRKMKDELGGGGVKEGRKESQKKSEEVGRK
jgi:hypothetical protein